MEYFKYQGEYRDSYYQNQDGTPIQFRDGAALNLNIEILGPYLYWDNRFHLDSAENGQVRATGWQWEGGVHIPFLPLDLFERHHSRHVLDEENPRNDKFPLENMVGVRVFLIGGRE